MIGTLIVKRKTAEGFEALNQRDLDTYLKDWANGVSMVTIKDGKVRHIQIYVFDAGEKFRTVWE